MEQPGECKVQYRKWSNQRTYMRDPWTRTMVGALTEGVGVAGWRPGKGRKIRTTVIAQSIKYN